MLFRSRLAQRGRAPFDAPDRTDVGDVQEHEREPLEPCHRTIPGDRGGLPQQRFCARIEAALSSHLPKLLIRREHRRPRFEEGRPMQISTAAHHMERRGRGRKPHCETLHRSLTMGPGAGRHLRCGRWFEPPPAAGPPRRCTDRRRCSVQRRARGRSFLSDPIPRTASPNRTANSDLLRG